MIKSTIGSAAGEALDIIAVTPTKSSTSYSPILSCSEFIVQFSKNATPGRERKPVHVKINGKTIDSLRMSVNDDGTCRFVREDGTESLKPLSSDLDALVNDEKIITTGRNRITFTHDESGGDESNPKKRNNIGETATASFQTTTTARAYLFLWNASDSIIVSDIDGTITKSDIRGVVDTVLTERYEYTHSGVCKLFSEMSQMGHPYSGGDSAVRFIYLTSRPISCLSATRKFIYSVRQNHAHEEKDGVTNKNSRSASQKLPLGAILCNDASLARVVYNELIAKKAHEFKAKILSKQVVQVFAQAGRNFSDSLDLFLAGFGNKNTDARAYQMVGMDRRDIYIIDEASHICCLGDDPDAESPSQAKVDSLSMRRDDTEDRNKNAADPVDASTRRTLTSKMAQTGACVKNANMKKADATVCFTCVQSGPRQMHRSFFARVERDCRCYSMPGFPTTYYSTNESFFSSYDDPQLVSSVREKMNRKLSAWQH